MTQKEWKAEATKVLILKGMSRAQLAEALDYTESYIQHVLCGDVRPKKAVRRVSDYLGIEPYSE